MDKNRKNYYKGWAALAAYIAWTEGEPLAIQNYMIEHEITIELLEEAEVDDLI